MTPKTYAGLLAGGKGSRFGGIGIPKPLLTVSEKPMLHKAVEALFRIGFNSDHIVCVAGYLGEQIKEYFGKDILYVDQTDLNGNASALDVLLKFLKTSNCSTLLVVQGDDSEYAGHELLKNLLVFHERVNSQVTLSLTDKPDEAVHRLEYIYGSDNQIIDIVERKSSDSTGRYVTGQFVFNISFLRRFLPMLKQLTPPEKELGIVSLLQLGLSNGVRMYGVDTEIKYIAINTLEGLSRARAQRC